MADAAWATLAKAAKSVRPSAYIVECILVAVFCNLTSGLKLHARYSLRKGSLGGIFVNTSVRA